MISKHYKNIIGIAEIQLFVWLALSGLAMLIGRFWMLFVSEAHLSLISSL